MSQKGNSSDRFYGLHQESTSEKAKLKIYGDLAKHLWNTFTKLASDYARIYITFNLYVTHSIKETERNRRNTVEGISTDIFGSE